MKKAETQNLELNKKQIFEHKIYTASLRNSIHKNAKYSNHLQKKIEKLLLLPTL